MTKKIICVFLVLAIAIGISVPFGSVLAEQSVIESFDIAPQETRYCENYASVSQTKTQGQASFCISTSKARELFKSYNSCGMFLYSYASPLNLSSYKSFSIDIYISKNLSGSQGVTISFITDASKDCGYNCSLNLDNANAGWCRKKFTPVEKTFESDSLSSVSKIAVSFHNYAMDTDDVIICFDNLVGDNVDRSVPQTSEKVNPLNAMGDIDGSSSVSAVDALLALRYSVKKYSLNADLLKTADVDGKNGVNSTDALMILQKSVDLDVDFVTYYSSGTATDEFLQNAEGCYTRSSAVLPSEGEIHSLYQTFNSSFNNSFCFNSDCILSYVIVKSTNIDFEKYRQTASSIYGHDMKIGIMFAANRDNGEYGALYPQRGNKDIQTKKDGSYCLHGSGVYYMVPSTTYIEYKWSLVEKFVKAGASVVAIEEPEYWNVAGYSEGFKEEWKNYFGTNWVDPASSVSAMYQAQEFKAYLFKREMEYIGSRLKRYYPQVEFIVASHSTPNYSNHKIATGLSSYLNLTCVDGVIAQSWSDVLHMPTPYGGSYLPGNSFATAMFEYSSYQNTAKSKPVYLLEDAASDGNFSEDAVKEDYKLTVFSALIQQETSRFQNCIWPERAYTNDYSDEYKGYQLTVAKMLTEVCKSGSISFSGSKGVYMGVSDSAGWHVNMNDLTTSYGKAINFFYGLSAPLINDGVPVNCLDLDNLKSVDDLKDVNLLILSYDVMKPKSETVNSVIAQWVKNGGRLLYIGGYDEFSDINSSWWKSKGTTPLKHLISCLGVNLTVTQGIPENSVPIWVGSSLNNNCSIEKQYAERTYRFDYSSGNIATFMQAGNCNVGISAISGNGCVTMLGLPTNCLTSTVAFNEIMPQLAFEALKGSKNPYYSSDFYSSLRGRYYAYYGLSGNKKTGNDKTYIDLFSKDMDVLNPGSELKANVPYILYDISSFRKGSTPLLAFTNGNLKGNVSNSPNKTVFTLNALNGSVVSSRLVSNGKYPVSVTATDKKGKKCSLSVLFDKDSQSLLIKNFSSELQSDVTVTVVWSSNPAGDISTYDDFAKTDVFKTNSGTMASDANLVSHNCSANTSYYYCDNRTEAVWAFDLKKHKSLILNMDIGNNYLLSISFDGKNYEKICAYSDISSTQTHSYSTSVSVDTASYNGSATAEKVYIKLSSCFDGGWGGYISGYSLRYLESRDIPFVYTSQTQLTNSLQKSSDLPLIESNCLFSESCYFCDNKTYAIWEINLNSYKAPVITMTIAQNYLLSVSFDRKNWTTVADYSKIGQKIQSADNITDITLSASDYAQSFSAEAMYIKLSSCYDGGFGGNIFKYVINYKVPAQYTSASRTEYTNVSTFSTLDLLYECDCHVNEEFMFCDNNTHLTFAVDRNVYKNAEFILSVANNYVVSASTDNKNWTVVEDYSKIGPVVTDGSNRKDVTVRLDRYADDDSPIVFVKLSSCYLAETSQGFGGQVLKVVLNYLKPSNGNLQSEQFKTNSSTVASDKFLIEQKSNVNDVCYYCDNNGYDVWKIDLFNYPNAVFSMYVNQNYKVLVSGDNKNWSVVADYSIGHSQIIGGDNRAIVSISPLGRREIVNSRYMYIKLTSCFNGGFGGAVTQYSVSYSK